MVELNDYEGLTPSWCPGCGNFGILAALTKSLVELNIEPYQVLLVSGIGQAGKLPHYTRANVLNMLHGRSLPAAAGAKLVNPGLTVIAIGGDGDGYGEGGNHFIHAARRNHDITYLVHDNQVYALTKGQASPTSDFGYITRTTPRGATVSENPVALAVAAGATFVARGFAGDIEHLAGLIKKGINHKGFALIDILQPCVSFNHKNTFSWYRERVYKLEDDGTYIGDNKVAAFAKALEWGDRIPIGVIYRHEIPSFEQQYKVLENGSSVNQPITPEKVDRLIPEFT
jgi:2-oxoglutarate/2-oxoacid ferredoxin oxidoreductase subunit beta